MKKEKKRNSEKKIKRNDSTKTMKIKAVMT